MIYSTKTYKEKFHPTKSIRTVSRMIKSSLLPSNHLVVSKLGRECLINVCEDKYELLSFHAEFAILFNKECDRTLCSATKFCIENNLDLKLFVKIIGV